ncbi:hypothetical protein BU26DRAFT_513402 [Trematosphaeria pertusa]|uniref:Uncharacterized protein n=1 Tax=Trematosphaeria pertusa TaxID=390896 RepID=A0A6A6J167_9PLEO|nr:uncharacterized protein BU26DRAFT_513402 [Trematosphaeria pertusa]KAF2256595.1 hypothetical protein BU26DRAFT_513402 [Trematosphaeria pertusa]
MADGRRKYRSDGLGGAKPFLMTEHQRLLLSLHVLVFIVSIRCSYAVLPRTLSGRFRACLNLTAWLDPCATGRDPNFAMTISKFIAIY